MTEESVVLELSERTNAILAFVNSRPQTTPIDVASELDDIDNSTASTYLTRLHKSGHIGKRCRGIYTPKGYL
ncbi:hypothetical protein [Rhodococcus sp. 1139]|uniref:hypothetical protein n=1 Tax=Rhodococcus sp. 1139 TaxID=1833762 RepID=UPI0008732E66|nr:hypothetical protein [Rhodococcus sp. 1139]OFE09585.1 hypothetical protein A5N83_06705 [Rhodococcus sp. 1139]